MDDSKPRSAEAILALPKGQLFSYEDRMVDGQLVRSVSEVPTVAIFHEDTDPIHVFDAEGQAWKLGRYADGRWFRRRA